MRGVDAINICPLMRKVKGGRGGNYCQKFKIGSGNICTLMGAILGIALRSIMRTARVWRNAGIRGNFDAPSAMQSERTAPYTCKKRAAICPIYGEFGCPF